MTDTMTVTLTGVPQGIVSNQLIAFLSGAIPDAPIYPNFTIMEGGTINGQAVIVTIADDESPVEPEVLRATPRWTEVPPAHRASAPTFGPLAGMYRIHEASGEPIAVVTPDVFAIVLETLMSAAEPGTRFGIITPEGL